MAIGRIQSLDQSLKGKTRNVQTVQTAMSINAHHL